MKEETFYLGKITRLHGYKGAMILFLDVDGPEHYYGLDSVFIELNGELIPHFITRCDPRANQLIVEFEGVSGEEQALTYVNKAAYLPLELLPKLSGKQFYFHEVLGFEIVDVEFGTIGKIESITDHPSNPLFVCRHEGREVLIPMHDDCLVSVDRSKAEITVKTPPGLLDLYLGDSNERQDD